MSEKETRRSDRCIYRTLKRYQSPKRIPTSFANDFPSADSGAPPEEDGEGTIASFAVIRTEFTFTSHRRERTGAHDGRRASREWRDVHSLFDQVDKENPVTKAILPDEDIEDYPVGIQFKSRKFDEKWIVVIRISLAAPTISFSPFLPFHPQLVHDVHIFLLR